MVEVLNMPDYSLGRFLMVSLRCVLVSTLLMVFTSSGIAEDIEINTLLMHATFKIEGPGSLGTCFFVGLRPPEARKDTKVRAPVLVTAAHILEAIQGATATLHLRTKKDDSCFNKFLHPIRIRQGTEPLWIRHASADVAVMHIKLPEQTYVTFIAPEFLATDADLKHLEIHPGDELRCLGFPFGIEANPAGFPILRSGRIASYPIWPTHQTKTMLFDFSIYEGNSGGPVYLVERGRTYGGTIHLDTTNQIVMGLVSGEPRFEHEVQMLRKKETEIIPLSLGVIVHATWIKETIDRLWELLMASQQASEP